MCGGAYHKTAEPAGSIVSHKLHFKSKGRSVFTAKSAGSLLLCSTCWVLVFKLLFCFASHSVLTSSQQLLKIGGSESL